MSIFIICQCVWGALAASDSASYLGISSKQTAKLVQIVLLKARTVKKKRVKHLKNWNKETLCKKRWNKNKTRN